MKKAKVHSPTQNVMILESDGQEEDAGLDVPWSQPSLQDFTLATIATRPAPTVTREEEEEVTMLAEELGRYFLSSFDLISHLEPLGSCAQLFQQYIPYRSCDFSSSTEICTEDC